MSLANCVFDDRARVKAERWEEGDLRIGETITKLHDCDLAREIRNAAAGIHLALLGLREYFGDEQPIAALIGASDRLDRLAQEHFARVNHG